MSWHFWNDRVVLCRQFRTITAGLFSSHSHSDHCYLWSLIDWNGAWGMLGYGKAKEHFTHHLLSLAPLNADAQACSFSGGVRLSGWAGAEQKRAGFDHRLHHEEKRLPLLQRHVSGGETDFRLSLMSFQTRMELISSVEHKKVDVSLNVHAALFHTVRSDCDQELSSSNNH